MIDSLQNFKPVQVSCTPRTDFTFVLCATPEELLFLNKFSDTGVASCPLSERNRFEVIDIEDLIEKGVISREQGCADYYYSLTKIGKGIVKALKKSEFF